LGKLVVSWVSIVFAAMQWWTMLLQIFAGAAVIEGICSQASAAVAVLWLISLPVAVIGCGFDLRRLRVERKGSLRWCGAFGRVAILAVSSGLVARFYCACRALG